MAIWLSCSLQEFAYYGSTEVKQDKPERIEESLKEEEGNGSAGEEAADGVEAKNQQKWVISKSEKKSIML